MSGHGHPEPTVAWREVYLYDETCAACGCQLVSCPDCELARCLHCQPLCAVADDPDVLVLKRPPGVGAAEWRDAVGFARVNVALKAGEGT